MSTSLYSAPPLSVSQWFSTEAPIALDDLRGRVVVLYAFQMLCPACVSHGLPQAMKVHRAFSRSDVVVLGLHSVFEHHEAMAPHALKAFLSEYRIAFPVGVDKPSASGPIPTTMAAYGLKGTPSLIILDRQGVVRLNHFGMVEDLQLGALLGSLVAEPVDPQQPILDLTGADEASGAEAEKECSELECRVRRT